MPANGTTNGHQRVLKAGVWAPIPTFYDDNEELDVATFKSHVVRLAKAGMQPVVCGSMGEAHHLTQDERVTLFKAARAALDEAKLDDTVLIAGTGGNSTRATIALSKAAAEAGADVVIVIPPGYFAGAISKAALKQFFLDVQDASPLPVMMYNYPGAAGGLDLDSDLVIDIAKSGPNICGIKLTCGAVGKLTRITGATGTPGFQDYPRKSAVAPEFVTLGGFADFLLPTVLGSRAHGAIMGLGNIYPNALAHLFELSHKLATSSSPDPKDLAKAIALQDLASEADASFARAGIAGTKWWLHKHNGYPTKRVRRPLLEFDDARGAALEKEEGVRKFMEVEKSLAQ
ncbi:hypothetical protein BCR39DRAFT_130127 [Naematelia encephala]|uniref:Dihydrodipicolinate synthetase n=1 Tax=Naematelia encephala TaxID=71784 RepID=A0A1Y2BJK1_9TREE|nr:hypothetical protein BCR39DRAFT_130127 [Naematelia encephala]